MQPIKTEYRRSDYYFARTCENFYPEPEKHIGDRIVYIAALVLMTAFLVGMAWGM